MNLWKLFLNQVKSSYPNREIVRVVLKLDVNAKIVTGQSTDATGLTVDAKPAPANRAIVAMFVNAHRNDIPNIHTVGLEFDVPAGTVEITAFGNKDGQPVKGTAIEKL